MYDIQYINNNINTINNNQRLTYNKSKYIKPIYTGIRIIKKIKNKNDF